MRLSEDPAAVSSLMITAEPKGSSCLHSSSYGGCAQPAAPSLGRPAISRKSSIQMFSTVLLAANKREATTLVLQLSLEMDFFVVVRANLSNFFRRVSMTRIFKISCGYCKRAEIAILETARPRLGREAVPDYISDDGRLDADVRCIPIVASFGAVHAAEFASCALSSVC